MRVLAAVTLVLLPALASADDRPQVRWTRDHDHAFTEAEERGAPLLLHFRGANCGGRSAPGDTEGRDGTGMAGGIVRPRHDTALSDCDLMEQEVWPDRAVAEGASRFVPVLVDGGDQTLNVRYQVVVNPTTIVADPWGNEVFRVAHYLEPAKMARLLGAIPRDFGGLSPWGAALRKDPADLRALMGAAAFYESAGLRQASERYYERAAASPAAGADLTARRQVAIARGLNLILMKRDKDAAALFQRALDESPAGAGSDALLLGLVNAHLQGGRRKEAEAALRTLEKGWPDSPYTARAKQNLGR